MNKRERARVVKDLRCAAMVADAIEATAHMSFAWVITDPEQWFWSAGMARDAIGDDAFYEDKMHAPLALLFVAAAVEAGDWP